MSETKRSLQQPVSVSAPALRPGAASSATLGHGAGSGEETNGRLRKKRGRDMYLPRNWKRRGEQGFQNRSFKILGLDE